MKNKINMKQKEGVTENCDTNYLGYGLITLTEYATCSLKHSTNATTTATKAFILAKH